jgi:aminopeptidase YwaD
MPDQFDAMANECLRTVDRIVREGGSRMAGSEADRKTAQEFTREMESFCDRSGLDRFAVHPGVFFAYTKILPVVYVVGIAGLFVSPLFALPMALLLALGVAMMLSVFGFYRHKFDRFFPSVECGNAWGVIEPSGVAKRQLIISGHHDSACVARILQGPLHNLIGPLLFLPYAFFAAEIVILLARAFGASTSPMAFWALIAGLPAVINYFFAFDLRTGVPGAGDNLVSSVMAIRLGRYLAEHRPELLPDTRVYIVSFDAEEAGLRGSAEFFRAHGEEFRGLPTVHLNFDSLYSPRQFHCILKDINGSVALDPKLAKAIMETGREIGLDIKPFSMSFPYGGTDAAESARAGISSVSIVGMPTDIVQKEYVYHTMRDLASAIEPGVVSGSMRLVHHYLESR